MVGRLDHHALRELWARSQAIYFPTEIESFGYPLAEARVHGQPVIALDTEQNREVAGAALCSFTRATWTRCGAPPSLRLTTEVISLTPAPFDPDAYFTWRPGPTR